MSLHAPARLLALAVVASVALVGCTSEDDVLESARAAAGSHTGAWDEAQLRAAVGDDATVVHVEATEDGGHVVVELSRSGGTRKTTGTGSKKRTKTSDRKVSCLDVTISGTTVSSHDYTESSSSGRPSC